MENKLSYKTQAMAFFPFGIIFYCFDEKIISFEELITIEQLSMFKAFQKKEKLFKKIDTTKNKVVNSVVSLN